MLRMQPEANTTTTMIQCGVSAPNSAKTGCYRRRSDGAADQCLAKSRRRAAEFAKKVRTSIAPNVDEKVSIPACTGLRPKPDLKQQRQTKNGLASRPMRQMPPFSVAMLKVLIFSRLRSSTGASTRLGVPAIGKIRPQRQGEQDYPDRNRNDRPPQILDTGFEKKTAQNPAMIKPTRSNRVGDGGAEIVEQPQCQKRRRAPRSGC